MSIMTSWPLWTGSTRQVGIFLQLLFGRIEDRLGHDPKLVAYDKTTGKVVGEAVLPRNATGAPMTYMLNGKRFLVIPTGGANLPAELIALSLP